MTDVGFNEQVVEGGVMHGQLVMDIYGLEAQNVRVE